MIWVLYAYIALFAETKDDLEGSLNLFRLKMEQFNLKISVNEQKSLAF
jgi:hypothetical protein